MTTDLGMPLFIPSSDPECNDFVFNGHAGAGPSGAHRWMSCTASLRATREFLETLSPRQQKDFARSGSAARQGTTAHAAAEAKASVVLGQIQQEELEQTLLELAIMPDDGEHYDDEMGDFIQEYVDLVASYHTDGRTVLLEERVGAVIPLTGSKTGEVYVINGSGDFIVLPSDDEPELVVGDLKYGDGVHVSVDENPQIRLYALGALSALADPDTGKLPNIETVTYYIVQPRIDGIKVWSEPLADLIAWRDTELAPLATAALYGEGAEFNPTDDNCQWCPAKGSCAPLAEQRLSDAANLFDTIVMAEFDDGPGAFPETSTLTDQRLGELLAQVRGLITIHDDLKEEAQRRLHRGQAVPGFHLVQHQDPRRWAPQSENELDPSLYDPADETTDGNLTTEAAEAIHIYKLRTPKQALDILAAQGLDGEALLGDLIEKPLPRPIIAPVTSNKKAWTGPPPEKMFDAIEDEERDQP